MFTEETMKKLLLFLAFASAAWAQNVSGNVKMVQVDPSGSCGYPQAMQFNMANQALWGCGTDAAWHNISGGSGGTGVASFSGDGTLITNVSSTGAVTATLTNKFTFPTTTGGQLSACGDETTYCVFEEFNGALTITGNIGSNGWAVRNLTGTPVVTLVSCTLPHLGILQLTTTAVAGQGGDLVLAPSTLSFGAIVAGTQPWLKAWSFKLGTNTDTSFRIGFTGAVAAAIEPLLWAGLRFDTQTGCADANFIFDINNTGGLTSPCVASSGNIYSVSTASGVPSTATWYKLTMTNIIAGVAAANQISMSLYSEATSTTPPTLILTKTFCNSGCDVATSATFLTGVVGPMADIVSATGGGGAAKNVQLDYFKFWTATPAR